MFHRLTHLAAGALSLLSMALAQSAFAYDIVYDPNVYNYIGQSNNYLNSMLSANQSALDLLKKIYAKQLEQYGVQTRDHLSYNSSATSSPDSPQGGFGSGGGGDLMQLFTKGLQGFNSNSGSLGSFINGLGSGANGVMGQQSVLGNGLGQIGDLNKVIGAVQGISNILSQLKGNLNSTAQTAALREWTFQDFMKYEMDKSKSQGLQSQTIFDQMKSGLNDARTRADSAKQILNNLQGSGGMNQSLQNIGLLLGLVIDGANAADRNNNVLITMLNNQQTQQTLDRTNDLQRQAAQYTLDKQYHEKWAQVFDQMANMKP